MERIGSICRRVFNLVKTESELRIFDQNPYVADSTSSPWTPASGQPRNVYEIIPHMKLQPTITFQPRRILGPGLNLLITIPEIRKPNTIPISDIGPVNIDQSNMKYVDRQ